MGKKLLLYGQSTFRYLKAVFFVQSFKDKSEHKSLKSNNMTKTKQDQEIVRKKIRSIVTIQIAGIMEKRSL